MSKVYINVFFSSNSQPPTCNCVCFQDVKGLYQCFLFKQFTTSLNSFLSSFGMSKVYINVFFSSNSQLQTAHTRREQDVKGLYQCFLFKQFTTFEEVALLAPWMSKVYINVFFSSNSQRIPHTAVPRLDVKGLYQCFLFKQFTTIQALIICSSECQRSISLFSFQAILQRMI